MRSSRRTTSGLLAVLLLAGCNSAPTNDGQFVVGPVVSSSRFVDERRERAMALESSGSLREALSEWWVIDAISPSALSTDAIARLEQDIAEQLRQRRAAAKKAKARGDHAAAKQALLDVLALAPTDREAMDDLRRLAKVRARAQLAEAPAQSAAPETAYTETGVPIAKQMPVSSARPVPASARGNTRLSSHAADVRSASGANFQLAMQHLERNDYEQALVRLQLASQRAEAPADIVQKHIAETRRKLAEQLYDEGVSAFRSRQYEAAQTLFEKALEYDASHRKARFYLATTRQLQDHETKP